MIPLITTPDALGSDWLTDVLAGAGALDSGAVTDVEVTPVGEQGQTGEVLRVALQYDNDATTAPPSVIVKLAPRHETVRRHMSSLGMYQREVGFYRHFTDPGVAVPRCYHAAADASTGHFVLVLEDMADSRVGEIWTTAPLDDLAQAVEAIAPMHAKWWCSPKLREASAWLPQHDDMSYFQVASGAAYKGSLPVVEARFAPYFRGYLGRVARLLSDRWDAWSAYREGTPFSLVHGDYHPKQIFFPSENGGRFAVFDWQTVASGPPAMDVARILLKGLRPQPLRDHQEELVTRYHAALARAGVDTPLEQLFLDVRSRMLVTLYITVFVLANTRVEVLDEAAASRGANYLERLLADLEESLEDNRMHEVLERLG